MNKWRLLLLSIFALLHITTSDRIFIDGRYGCCDHTQRFSPSDTRISVHESYQERRNLPQIRQLSTSDKYSTPEEPDTDVTIATRRSRVEYGKQRSLDVLDTKNRRVIARQQTRLLSTIPEVIRGRKISRDRINERVNDQRIVFRNERFERQLDRKYQRYTQLPSMTRNDNRRISETRNLKIRHVRHLDDNICEVTDNAHENQIETQLTRINTVNNNYDDGKDGVLREVRENGGRKISTRKIVFDTRGFENERNSRLTMRQYKREDFSREKELSRITRRNNIRNVDMEFKEHNGRVFKIKKSSLTRSDVPLKENRERSTSHRDIKAKNIIKRNVRTDDRSNLKENNGRISQINRRSSTRNVNDASLNNGRERSNRVDFRRKNIIRTNVRSEERRDSKENNERIFERSTRIDILAKNVIRSSRDLESKASRQISRQQRYYTENRLERDTRVYDDRLRNTNRNVELTRMDHKQRQRDSEDYARDVRVNDRVEFNERNFNDRINFPRSERRIQKRSLSEEVSRNRDARIDRNRQVDDRNSMKYMEKDSKINEIRHNLPAIENRVRAVLRSQRNNQISNDAILRTTLRTQEVLSLPLQIRERRYLRESRDAHSRERRANEQTNRLNIRPEINSDRISNLRRERFEADRRVKQDQNRISLRIRRNVVAEQRSVKNVIAYDNDSRQITRRSNNEDHLSVRKLDTRDSRDERMTTKNTEERRINLRQETTLLNEKRIFRSDHINSQRSIRMNQTNQIKTRTDVFEVKWQYLFYIVQAVYLCSLLVRIPKDEGTKKMRISNWFTPAELLKID